MKLFKSSRFGIVLAALALLQPLFNIRAQIDAPKTFTVTTDKLENGSLKITPPLPDDGKVVAGTVLTVTLPPADGYAVDSGYYSIPGPWGRAYAEFATPEFQVTVDRNKGIGASFIEKKALEGFTVTQDVVYSQPGVKKLKYDVFSPLGAKNLPCIVIIHGGGWTSNTEDIMRGLARELVRGGGYVAISIDYRWLGTGDGDKVPNTMANLIEDVFGAIAHIQEHAKAYGADATRIAVTGDSAGGHLSATAINMVDKIGDGGFGIKEGIYQFKPTYMPPGKSIEQVRTEMARAIKAASPTYGVFGGPLLAGVGSRRGGPAQPEAVVKAIAPQENIPNIKDRAVPQYLLRGTNDPLIQHAGVQAYADALKAAGQNVVYDQVEGASHAFFDWKPDAGTKATFAKYGVPYAAKIKAFFDTVLYPKASATPRP